MEAWEGGGEGGKSCVAAEADRRTTAGSIAPNVTAMANDELEISSAQEESGSHGSPGSLPRLAILNSPDDEGTRASVLLADHSDPAARCVVFSYGGYHTKRKLGLHCFLWLARALCWRSGRCLAGVAFSV